MQTGNCKPSRLSRSRNAFHQINQCYRLLRTQRVPNGRIWESLGQKPQIQIQRMKWSSGNEPPTFLSRFRPHALKHCTGSIRSDSDSEHNTRLILDVSAWHNGTSQPAVGRGSCEKISPTLPNFKCLLDDAVWGPKSGDGLHWMPSPKAWRSSSVLLSISRTPNL